MCSTSKYFKIDYELTNKNLIYINILIFYKIKKNIPTHFENNVYYKI